MNVECDYGKYADLNEVYLKCSRLPADAANIVLDYLGLRRSAFEFWDWRFHESYGEPYCSEYDAMALEIIE